jgi:hypothetical protein
LIFTGRDFSLGVTERAKQELCFYIRRRLEPTPSGGVVPAGLLPETAPSGGKIARHFQAYFIIID